MRLKLLGAATWALIPTIFTIGFFTMLGFDAMSCSWLIFFAWLLFVGYVKLFFHFQAKQEAAKVVKAQNVVANTAAQQKAIDEMEAAAAERAHVQFARLSQNN